MTGLFVVVGAVLGGIIDQFPGVFFGGAIGFLLSRCRDLRRRLDEFEQSQAWFERAQSWFGSAQAWFEEAQARPPVTVEQPAAADPREGGEEAEAAPAEAAGPADISRPAPEALSPVSPWVSEEAQPTVSPWVSEEAQSAPASPQAEPAAAEPAPAPAASSEKPAEAVRTFRPAAEPAPVPSVSPAALADPLTRFADAVKTWALTGNVPVKVGVLISLIGLGFLIREANERGLIELTVEMILAAVTMFGLALLVVGWRLRARRPVYGLSLQGGGIAVLYLTTYAAFAVYDVLAPAPAAAAVVAVTVGAGVLAVTQDSRTLALLGIVGGFLAPVLAYSRPEDHIWVFSFYAVLNAAIVGVAWFKVWPELNLAGLGFTFAISAYWLLDRHTSDDWASIQPFIALFVLMYAAIPVLFAARAAPDLKDVRTAPLVFGTPFIGFGLQAILIGHTEYGLAASALALALVHGGLAAVARKLGGGGRALTESYVGLGAAFAVIAVPFALDAYYTATVWALQGLLLVWFGLRRSRLLAVVAGGVLQALAGSSLGSHLSESLPYPPDAPVIVNEYFLGAVVLAGAGLVSGWLLHRSGDRIGADESVCWLALAWGVLWWLAGGLMEIGYQASAGTLSASLAFAALSFAAAGLSARRLRWPHLGALGPLILPTMVVALYASVVGQTHPLGDYGWAAWPVSVAAYYAFLRLREGEFPKLQTALHAGGYWVMAVLIGVEVLWQTDQIADGAWPPVAALAAVLALVGGTLGGLRSSAWPLGAHRRRYVTACAGPVLVLLATLVFLAAVLSDGDFSPLPHLPLLNPLGLLAALLLAVALGWRRLAAFEEGDHPFKDLVEAPWAPAMAAAGTVLATMSAARTVHHWLGVPFDGESLFDSTALQVSLSILWAAIALAGMVVGVRSARRAVWVAGASFMGVVVLKLFLVELSDQNALGRVVSFIGVGVLLLIVGYFAPVPPPASAESPDE